MLNFQRDNFGNSDKRTSIKPESFKGGRKNCATPDKAPNVIRRFIVRNVLTEKR